MQSTATLPLLRFLLPLQRLQQVVIIARVNVVMVQLRCAFPMTVDLSEGAFARAQRAPKIFCTEAHKLLRPPLVMKALDVIELR